LLLRSLGDPFQTRVYTTRIAHGIRAPRCLAVVGLLALGVASLFGQGYGHGTSVAVLTSADSIVAAVDSKEVNRQYLSDGTQVVDDRIACKVRRTGQFYVFIAGISRATDGFDALQAAGNLYRDSDTLDEFTARLMDGLPAHLSAILNVIRSADQAAFDRDFSGQDVLQMSLLGTDQGRPRAVIVTFRAVISESGRVAIEPHRTSCMSDCKNPNSIYLLGMHDEADVFVHAHQEIAGDTTTGRALQLIHMEYASHPEAVGGPETVVRVTGAGAVMEQSGACITERIETGVETLATGLPRIQSELDEAIAAVENVVVREDVSQHSKRGAQVRSDGIQGVVRVIHGAEQYTWSGQGANSAAMPEPWCGGELATMMRATREALQQGEGVFSRDTSSSEPATVLFFHSTGNERHWQLVIGSRTYALAFDGRAWFSQATGKLLRIRWETTDLHLPASAGITRIEWDETFSTNNIAGRPFLTPGTAVYRVSYSRKVDRTDWTETRFSDFRRFGATENIQFEEAAIR
jgi:hypothetical protein